jgi:hypothetical protein
MAGEKGSRINVNFAEVWSGRWESNPTPDAAKLLIFLVHRYWLASSSVHLRGYSLDCFPVRVTHNMAVNLKRGARICVPKLPLDNFGRGVRNVSHTSSEDRQYCRRTFARQRASGIADTAAKKGPPLAGVPGGWFGSTG